MRGFAIKLTNLRNGVLGGNDEFTVLMNMSTFAHKSRQYRGTESTLRTVKKSEYAMIARLRLSKVGQTYPVGCPPAF